jgi:hypothetical protein
LSNPKRCRFLVKNSETEISRWRAPSSTAETVGFGGVGGGLVFDGVGGGPVFDGVGEGLVFDGFGFRLRVANAIPVRNSRGG